MDYTQKLQAQDIKNFEDISIYISKFWQVQI